MSYIVILMSFQTFSSIRVHMTQNCFRYFLEVQCFKCESLKFQLILTKTNDFIAVLVSLCNTEKLAFKSRGQNHTCDVTLVAMSNNKYGGK